MRQVEIQAAPLEPLAGLLTAERSERFLAAGARAGAILAGRVVWNISATATGGGVAEMLQNLLAYARGADVDTRWLVLDGDPAFFAITKRIHNALHGAGSALAGLGPAEHRHYERVLADNLDSVHEQVRPGDIVVLHDPQTAGMVEGVRALGAYAVWRCHVGRDELNPAAEHGWAFLRGYLENADAFVFSRRRYAPTWIPVERLHVIPPSIDPFSVKNRDLSELDVGRVLRRVGLTRGSAGADPVEFTRRDGTTGVVRPHTELLGGTSPPPPDAPVVLQVSRWDRLKDMLGVLSAFARYIGPDRPDAHLMLAGPDVSSVSDDPEGAQVLAACRTAWTEVPGFVRSRCHLLSIPMDDVEENAIIVNALQRHAAVGTQKSLVEGFGLTVAEAMWKSRPVVASAVGGILDQITDGVDGLLLPDPSDLEGFARRVVMLLDDRPMSARLGHRARERVRERFLGDRHLTQYVDLFGDLIGE